MIDKNARQQLIQRGMNSLLSDSLSQMSENMRLAMDKKDPSPLLEVILKQLVEIDKKLNQETEKELKNIQDFLQKNQSDNAEFKKLDNEQYQKLVSFTEDIRARLDVFDEIRARIDKGQAVLFPKVDIGKIEQPLEVTVKNPQKLTVPPETKVFGKVDVGEISKLPPVQITNLAEISSNMQGLFNELQTALAKLVLSLPKGETKKATTAPVEIKQWNELITNIDDLKTELVNGFNILIKNSQEASGIDPSRPMAVEIVSDRIPRPVANPVTNISINGLGGVAKSTAITVTSSATALPTSALTDRRGVVIFNNDSSTILYIGGADVTTTNGMPVPAQAYSPALDIGDNFTLYGIASGSINVRVLELSDIATGR